jgi:hypothetical protein
MHFDGWVSFAGLASSGAEPSAVGNVKITRLKAILRVRVEFF